MMQKQNSKMKAQTLAVQLLREQLRLRAVDCSYALSRSVSRLTSCDALPCPEYREEVAGEYAVTDKLLYLQNCRAALERCIDCGAACLRYRWRDGRVTVTRFRQASPGRIKVSGLA